MIKAQQALADSGCYACRCDCGCRDGERLAAFAVVGAPITFLVCCKEWANPAWSAGVVGVRQPVNVCFAARVIGGTVAVSDEAAEVAWVPPERLDDYDIHPAIRRRIAHALKHRCAARGLNAHASVPSPRNAHQPRLRSALYGLALRVDQPARCQVVPFQFQVSLGNMVPAASA
jgi:hypothetical protein